MHRILCLGILLTVAVTFAFAADEQLTPPAYKASLVCFNGKDNSGSSCRSTMAKIEGGLKVITSKLTCGYPGAVSEITWAYQGQKDGKDQYRVTRNFPSDTDHAKVSETDLSFDGKRHVLFQDDAQCIVVEIEPAKK
ncbi:MAG: hypothetical protein QM754_05460 [Tepidisphaeraceae bacterium]